MAEYYRTVFTIEDGDQSGMGLLTCVEASVREWGGDLTGLPIGGSLGTWEGNAQSLRVGAQHGKNMGYFWMVCERTSPEHEDERWRLGLRLATEGQDMEADIEVNGLESTSSLEYRAAPPAIVQTLLSKFNCSVDGRRLHTASQKVLIEDAPELIEEILNPQRNMPLIVVSENSTGLVSIDADHLQSRLLGIAVVYSYDHDVAWQFSKDLPRSLRCYDGTIRLFSPSCTVEDVPQQHPYWEPSDVERLSHERMISILGDECVNRLPRRGRRRLFSQVRNALRSEEVRDLEEYIESLETQRSDEEPLLARIMGDDFTGDVLDAEEISVGRYNARGRVARVYRNMADLLKEENRQLKVEIENLERSQRESAPIQPAPQILESESPPEVLAALPEPEEANEGVLQVVERARAELTGLRFFGSAMDSAREATRGGRYRTTDELFKVFKWMSTCAEKREAGLGISLEDWFSLRGINYSKHESETTTAQHGNARRFKDDVSGRHVSMPAHFRLRDNGFHLRVHVSWKKKENTWLVGHVGEHLPTSSDPH